MCIYIYIYFYISIYIYIYIYLYTHTYMFIPVHPKHCFFKDHAPRRFARPPFATHIPFVFSGASGGAPRGCRPAGAWPTAALWPGCNLNAGQASAV